MGTTDEKLIAALAARTANRTRRRTDRQAILAVPRFRLSHRKGSLAGNEQFFDVPSVLIGRGDDNDVALDPFVDPTVSANHAEIRWEPPYFVLYDMGSLNGTWVNGRQVRRTTLRDNDHVALGRQGARFVFRSDGTPTLPPIEADAGGATFATPTDDLQQSSVRLLIALIVLAATDALLHAWRILR